MTVAELAATLQCELVQGNADHVVSGVGNLKEAAADQLAPFTDEKYVTELTASKAGVILCKRGMKIDAAPAGAALLTSADPEITFLQAIRLFNPETRRKPGIHPSAVIEPGVTLGTDVHIGPFVYIESGTRIGNRCTILANTTIAPDCVIGDDCTLHPRVTLYSKVRMGNRVLVLAGAVLGADGFGYKFRGGKYIKVPHVGTVEIGDDVEIGSNTCIDRGALGSTRVGDGTKIDNLVQIGHNNVIGKHCVLCGQVGVAGSCTFGDYVVLGGQAGVADHITLGKGVRTGAGAGIISSFPAGQEVFGYPARESRSSIRAFAALPHLPELLKRVNRLEKKLDAKPE